MSRAVFLDRDGTLNVGPPPHEYLKRADQFVWLPGAVDGLALLARAGYRLAVVSNQRGVARGLVSASTLREIEVQIQRDLEAVDAAIDAFRYCPHELAEDCRCRKPKPGMLLDLAAELRLDVSASWMIGDALTDVEAGRAAGCRVIQIMGSEPQSDAALPAADLRDAARLILEIDQVDPAAGDSKPSTRAR